MHLLLLYCLGLSETPLSRTKLFIVRQPTIISVCIIQDTIYVLE